jgi:hypothetical protein
VEKSVTTYLCSTLRYLSSAKVFFEGTHCPIEDPASPSFRNDRIGDDPRLEAGIAEQEALPAEGKTDQGAKAKRALNCDVLFEL